MTIEMVDNNQRGRMMKYPDTFSIQYMYQGNENTYLNKVRECYLQEDMDVSYGGDRYRTFEGNEEGVVMETTITLNFEEIELITRGEILEGS